MIIQGQDMKNTNDIFVIAEIGNNHQGDLEICKRMIKAAKDAGRH
jgi:sialic acid synthase